MKPPIVVRPASPDDADRVFEMPREFATSYQPDRASFDRTFPGLACSEDANLLVARDEKGASYGNLKLTNPDLLGG
jgi:hypothetical protein